MTELNAMKFTAFAIEKIFWLVAASIPVIPPYVLYEFHSVLSCAENGICFRNGYPFLNSEGYAIVYLAVILVWPMCAWQLIGKHIFVGRLQPRCVAKFRVNRAAIFFGKLYWLIVAAIPLLFWYLFGTFHAPTECIGNGDCIKFYLPLNAVDKAAVLMSFCLLWPICLWKLVGNGRTARKMGSEETGSG